VKSRCGLLSQPAAETQPVGERDPQLGITKAGNVYLCSLLVECANHVLGPYGRARPYVSGACIWPRAEASSPETGPSSPSLGPEFRKHPSMRVPT
jgi:hypothetical protein